MSRTVFEKIKQLLDDAKVTYQVLEHEPTKTSEKAAEAREKLLGIPATEFLKRGAKAMIIRSEGKFYQFVISAAEKMDFAKIKKILQTQSASLATPEEVQRITDCVPGGVPPFGNLFTIPVYVDKSLLNNIEIDFNAGELTISIFMKLKDWTHVVQPIVADFKR